MWVVLHGSYHYGLVSIPTQLESSQVTVNSW